MPDTITTAVAAEAFEPTLQDYIVLKDFRWQGVIKRRGTRFNTTAEKAGFRRTKQMVDARQIEPWTKAALERLRHTMPAEVGTQEAAAAADRARARTEGRRQKGERKVEAQIAADAAAAKATLAAANAPPAAPAPAAPVTATDGVPQALSPPEAAAPVVPAVESAGVGAAKTNPKAERAAVEEVRGPVTEPPPGFVGSATVDFAGGGAYDIKVPGAETLRLKGQQKVRDYLAEQRLFAPGWNEPAPVTEPAPAAKAKAPAKKRG